MKARYYWQHRYYEYGAQRTVRADRHQLERPVVTGTTTGVGFFLIAVADVHKPATTNMNTINRMVPRRYIVLLEGTTRWCWAGTSYC
jgi:hypothetical protein